MIYFDAMDIVLYFRPETTPQNEKFLLGVRQIAEKAHIHVQVIDETPSRPHVQSLLKFWDARGVIVEYGENDRTIDPKIFGKVPIVFFNSIFSCLPPRTFSIDHDSRTTGEMAARELLLSHAQGYAFIPAIENPVWSQERERGFSQAIDLNGKKTSVLAWEGKPTTITARIQQIRAFLRQLPKPCAIFAANDSLAAEAITAAKLSGLSIPRSVSVLGVDNDTNICEHTDPPLTSIEPDFFQGGNLAMLLLVSLIGKGNSLRGPHNRIFGNAQIIRRQSTQRIYSGDSVVAQARELIRQEACVGLTAAQVAKTFPCARRMADIRFRQATGRSILSEIQAVRLERAKQMLRNPRQSLTAISDFCGFKHPNSLRKFFLKETGMTLSAWRKKQLRDS